MSQSKSENFKQTNEKFMVEKIADYDKASENWEKAMSEAERIFIQRREDAWNKLSKDQQLEMFCHITSKLKKAELDERRSYRGTLYTEFGFGPEAYGAAQLSGYLELHNSIYPDGLDEVETMQKGLRLYGIEATKEEIQEKLDKSRHVTRKIIASKNALDG